MLATFLALLGRLSSQDDLAVTTPVGLRPLQRFRHGIGCFINLLVTRASLDRHKTFRMLVHEVRDNFATGIDHLSFPYARLLPELGLSLNRRASQFSPSRSPTKTFSTSGVVHLTWGRWLRLSWRSTRKSRTI